MVDGRRRTRAIGAALVVAAAAAFAGALVEAGPWLVVARRTPACDLLVALGGGAEERIATAVDLLAAGACGRILITADATGANEDRAMRSMMERVAPASRVPPPSPSFSTFEDALVVRRVAEGIGARSVLVVTSPYHTRRVDLIFSRVLSGTGIGLGIYPSGSFYMDYARWWSSRRGWRMVGGEYVKLWTCGAYVAAAVGLAAGFAQPA